MSGKTPGQRAYEAWWANRPPVIRTAIAIPADWDGERPEVRAQWETAAAAGAAEVRAERDQARERYADAVIANRDLAIELAAARNERDRLRELLNEAAIAEPHEPGSVNIGPSWRDDAPAIVTAGTEHLLNPDDPDSPAWQRMRDIAAEGR